MALIAVSAGALSVVRSQQRQIAGLDEDVAALERELETARADPEADAPASPDEGLDGLLEGLGEGFGDLLDGELGDLFEGLFGGEGPSLGNGELMACLSPGVELDTLEPGGPAEQLGEIADRVEALRGLSFPEPTDARFLSGPEFEAELRERVEADLDRDRLDVERRRLAALGAIPADTDLAELQLELVSGQAAGFYDSDVEEIVVRVDDPDAPLRPIEQITLAHELEHALSDAVHGLPLGDEGPDDGDASLAALSLAEGGATVAMQQYAMAVLDLQDQLLMGLDPSIADARAQLDTFPHHIRRELLFPYEEGLAFACRLMRDDGWGAVDAAYEDPPTTTAQILWPERYLDGEAAATTPTPADPPGGWGEPVTDTLGAAELAWLFEAPGGERDAALDDPLGRAQAWAGGASHVWWRGDATAVALRLADGGGAPALCGSVRDWYTAAFRGGRGTATEPGEELVWQTDDQHAVLACDGDTVALGIGPDAATARAVTR